MKTYLNTPYIAIKRYLSRAIAVAAIAIGYGQISFAQISNGLMPGTIVMKMDCQFGQGHYVGHNYTKGGISGKLFPPDSKKGYLKVSTTDQKPFVSKKALEGGPILEYSISLPSGQTVVWDIAQIYSQKLGEYPDYIILTGSSGRFLRLNKYTDKLWGGGYTGIDEPKGGFEQVLEYTPLTCSKPSSVILGTK